MGIIDCWFLHVLFRSHDYGDFTMSLKLLSWARDRGQGLRLSSFALVIFEWMGVNCPFRVPAPTEFPSTAPPDLTLHLEG